ncbi:sensor histidine kinase [Polynucleobacter sp. MWH-HuK1]|uniref:sensor histidine kinase n=1 Tax=Polynucleobacter sp. MWH-HuK1 TaxID=1743158 RepID=UPI001C0B5D23|nr:ATP-binding protein [Polynucleobacter sp. MWH-HuK1]MBU3565851.1 GHKL domain-containing protein [Polynucleobacter sp. MWH-HuK1]
MFITKAVFPVLITLYVLCAGLVFVLIKNNRSARLWIYGCLSVAFGLGLVLLRPNFPSWLTYSVANFFTLFGWFLFFVSLEVLLTKKTTTLNWIPIVAALHGLIIEMLFYFQIEKYTATYLSFVWSIMNFCFFLIIIKWNREGANKFVRVMAYLFLATSLVWLFNIFIAVNHNIKFVIDDNVSNYLTLTINAMLAILRQLNYFAIHYDLINTEKEQIKRLLTERESLIASLLKANKTAATGALSASIAHELNQPLGASNLNIQFLKMKLDKGVLNPELGKEVLEALEADNQRAATIVKSLRSIFTESESNSELVRLGDSISIVLDIARPELKAKHIQIQLRVDEDCVIRVNPSEIEQVILNLVNNAAQALASSDTAERRITIEANKVGAQVLLAVSDNGSGVPDKFKSQLFELLNTTKKTGMGLGLWLCKHIVTRYGGSIHYEDAIGGGAKFVVKLPAN